MEIEARVLLLAIYKKQESETLKDVILMLENSRLFSLKEGKQQLKMLKNEGLVEGENLTFLGMQKAQEAEVEFKI